MTVRELMALLAQQDQDAPVRIYTDCHGCDEPITAVTVDDIDDIINVYIEARWQPRT